MNGGLALQQTAVTQYFNTTIVMLILIVPQFVQTEKYL
jgi:hypothetical protein